MSLAWEGEGGAPGTHLLSVRPPERRFLHAHRRWSGTRRSAAFLADCEVCMEAALWEATTGEWLGAECGGGGVRPLGGRSRRGGRGWQGSWRFRSHCLTFHSLPPVTFTLAVNDGRRGGAWVAGVSHVVRRGSGYSMVCGIMHVITPGCLLPARRHQNLLLIHSLSGPQAT